MSSYSVDNDNRRAESVHKAREEYKKKEAELKKKQNEEVNKLNKQHAQVLREVQKNHSEQLDGVRQKNQESLTAQDLKYQKEIEKVKDLHKNQSKQAAMQNENYLKEIYNQSQAELKKQEKIYESKEKALTQNYNNDRQKREENFNSAVEYMRNAQEEGLEAQRDRLESKHQKDSRILRSAQDEKVADLTLELQNTRDSKNAEIRNLNQRLVTDKERNEADKMSLLQQERKISNSNTEMMRDQYDKNLDELRQKYQRYNRETNTGNSEEYDNLKTLSERKMNEEIGKRNRKIRELRSSHDMETAQLRRQALDEKMNYMNNTKDQLRNADALREQVYESVNQRSAHEIKNMAKKNDQVMERFNRYYQDRLKQTEEKYNESIDTQVRTLEVEKNQTKRASEIDRQKLVSNLTRDKNNLESYYQEMLDEKDRLHRQDMSDQRNRMLNDKAAAIKQLEDKIRDNDNRNLEKQNLLVQKYEKEIADLKDANKAEKKRVISQYEKRIDEMQRDFKLQLDSNKLASESREKQLREQFNRQASTMEARHTEEKIKMATKVKT